MNQRPNRATDAADTQPRSPEAHDLERWRAALRCFKDGLIASRQALSDDLGADQGAAPVHPWPPRNLPSSPLPIELREEARALVAEADELTAELADAMADVKLDNRSRSRGSFGRTSHGSGQQHARWSFNA